MSDLLWRGGFALAIAATVWLLHRSFLYGFICFESCYN